MSKRSETLSPYRGHRRNADVDFLALDPHVDASVLRQAFFRDVHAGHDLDAGDQRGLITLELRRHGGLVQDAVNAVADPQFVLRRLEMDVRRAVFKGLPDDLVDKFDDAGFLVALGDFLVLAHEEFEGFILGHFVQGFRADAVILFEGLVEFRLGRERELDRDAGVEPDGVHHGGVKRVADGHLQLPFLELDRKDGILKRNLGGNLFARLRRDAHLGQVKIRPAQRLGHLLQKNVLRNPAFPADKGEQRLLRTVFRRHAPGLVPLLELVGGDQGDLGKKISD